jgi:hypothetical protein
MKIEYYNLYTLERLEKYITGTVNDKDSKMYSIYANPEHMHLPVSRSPRVSEEILATIIAESSTKFIQDNKLSIKRFVCLFCFKNRCR